MSPAKRLKSALESMIKMETEKYHCYNIKQNINRISEPFHHDVIITMICSMTAKIKSIPKCGKMSYQEDKYNTARPYHPTRRECTIFGRSIDLVFYWVSFLFSYHNLIPL